MLSTTYAPYLWIAIIYNAFWIGGLLNVLIYRIPVMIRRDTENSAAAALGKPEPHASRYNLAWPASRCPACGMRISFWQMIPVLSWIFMRGKCGHCHSHVSIRYPMIELACGALISGAYIKYGLSDLWLGTGLALFSVSMLCAAAIDAENALLPDMITLGLLWSGIIFNAHGGWISSLECLYIAAGTYIFFSAISWLFELIWNCSVMRRGDIKLITAIAAWMGMRGVFVVAMASMAIYLMYRQALARRWDRALPFGPFVCVPAVLLAWIGVQHV